MNANQSATFSITDTNLYAREVTLSTEDNAKLLQQLKSGFKRTINWNKYQSKISIERPSAYVDYLIHSSFQGVNRLFLYHLKTMHNDQITINISFEL